MKREYIYELHPNDHGFKSEDFDRKIYLNSYMDVGYASVNEIITKLRKVYCSSIGAEYMHITNPTEKVWFRERMEKEELYHARGKAPKNALSLCYKHSLKICVSRERDGGYLNIQYIPLAYIGGSKIRGVLNL